MTADFFYWTYGESRHKKQRQFIQGPYLAEFNAVNASKSSRLIHKCVFLLPCHNSEKALATIIGIINQEIL